MCKETPVYGDCNRKSTRMILIAVARLELLRIDFPMPIVFV